MKQRFAMAIVLGFILATFNLAFAGPGILADQEKSPPVTQATLEQIIDDALKIETVGNRDGNWQRHLLFQGLMPCLEKCQSKFESCMSSAGDDPTKQFRCGEERTACTLGCDNQFYNRMEF
ncbi:exported hypothetical protein [Nitrospina gracilis 3/211]|uniref:Uncharacterized protein n=1 Tax=Nitrospina gracilis (strain 3/211) TaxID=1266370 RepID=M1YM02_NITG3|nr:MULTISPECIES: hypothetical protein [Nitrospina]MCF8724358.1 hypothetical protein [Nitrospina sp. Nb-3]CCQ91511.1 exported hypothetical protein [Nitrospina gracilis 3/211]